MYEDNLFVLQRLKCMILFAYLYTVCTFKKNVKWKIHLERRLKCMMMCACLYCVYNKKNVKRKSFWCSEFFISATCTHKTNGTRK